MLKKEEIHIIKRVISQAKNVVIISHYNPDGDAVGSSLGLFHFFNNEGYNTKVILPNPFPDFLKWMKGSDTILVAQEKMKESVKLILDADLLFVLDMNAPNRAGNELGDAIVASKAFKILIDHHKNPDIECNIMLSTPKTTSTCELVYCFLFDYLKAKDRLTKEIAECLYVGIITDTGSLTYACNYPGTYKILSKLIKLDIDGEHIHRQIYDNYSESRIKLLGLSLSKRLTVLPDYATSFIYLTKQDLIDHNYKIGDTEGFVNYGLSLKSVQFTAFFIQRDNRIRISFRSKGNFDVSRFAKKHFNGGGHKNASAAYHYDTLENTIKYFEEIIKEYQQELLLQCDTINTPYKQYHSLRMDQDND